MITFIIGLVILIVGGMLYGGFCQKVFGPKDIQTPAEKFNDGVDFVPMKKWKNSLIELLNIAGTGPILGPIQGILFGPIAFLLIPIGNIIGGAMHDYFTGMISVREDGHQMPRLVRKYMGNKVYNVYNVFLCLVMLLVGAVFIYTPGDIFVTQVLNQTATVNNPTIWIVYGIIFVYYLCATLFPIDKIIGKVYPIFGAVLLISAVGVLIGLFAKGYVLENVTLENAFGIHPAGQKLIPMFFVTVACGIVSGFHSTQATLIGRSMKSEKEGRTTFYNMMVIEGFIAMIWAAAAMGIYNKGGVPAELIGTPSVIGIVSIDLLGSIGGLIAIIGIIVLPITSGDTALRSLRLMVASFLNIDQKPKKNRIMISTVIFALVAVILLYAKMSPEGFTILWRYFAWSNQTIAVFAFALIAIYLIKEKANTMYYLIALIPGMFYCYVISVYILNAKIGFNIPLNISYGIGVAVILIYGFMVINQGKRVKTKL